ncbi:unnamed protein product [Heterosigma akashiwo]
MGGASMPAASPSAGMSVPVDDDEDINDVASASAASFFSSMRGVSQDTLSAPHMGAGSRVFVSGTSSAQQDGSYGDRRNNLGENSILKAETSETRSTGAAGAYFDSI